MFDSIHSGWNTGNMDNSWQIQGPKEPEIPESQAIREVNPKPSGIPRRFILWGILGVLFFLAYTGGSYYVLFMRKDTPSRQIPVIPTVVPRQNPTPLPTPTAVPTIQPSQASLSDWLTYTNPTYSVSLKYPENMIINFNKTNPGTDPFLILLSYPEASLSGQLKIDIQDTQYLGQSDTSSRAIISLNLQQFAERKWNLNQAYQDLTIPTRRVGALEFITFAGQPAYSFTVVGSYSDDRSYQKLSQEYTYILTEFSGYKMIISYPTSDVLLNQIMTTITLQ